MVVIVVAAGCSDGGGGHQIYFYFAFSNITHYYVNIFVESIVRIRMVFSLFSFRLSATLKCSVHLLLALRLLHFERNYYILVCLLLYSEQSNVSAYN